MEQLSFSARQSLRQFGQDLDRDINKARGVLLMRTQIRDVCDDVHSYQWCF